MGSFFGENLRTLRKLKDMKLSEIADFTGFSQSQWNNWELGNAFPKFLDLVHISELFGISESDLIHSDLEKCYLNGDFPNNSKNGKSVPNMLPNMLPNDAKTTPKGTPNNTPNVKNEAEKEVITPFKKALNVYDLDSKAAAGMALLLDDGDKLKTAPNLYLPSIGTGMHIRIPISGDSMDKTIKNGDKVVAVRVLEENSFRDGDVYVIMTTDNEVLCKRVYRDGKHLELISDNENYAPLKLHHNKVLAIFRVKEVHSTDLRPYSTDIRREMAKMGHEIALIKQQLSKK